MMIVAIETASCFPVTGERKRREWLKGSWGQRFTVCVSVCVCMYGSGNPKNVLHNMLLRIVNDVHVGLQLSPLFNN